MFGTAADKSDRGNRERQKGLWVDGEHSIEAAALEALPLADYLGEFFKPVVQ
jgi:hypothetical protein